MQAENEGFSYDPLYCRKFNKDLTSFDDCDGCKWGKKGADFISCRYCERKFDHKTNSVIAINYRADYLKVLSGKKSVTFTRGGGLGDVIRLTPLIRELKRRLPHLKIGVRCHSDYVPLFFHNPLIDNLFSYEDEPVTDQDNVLLDLGKGFELEDHSVDGIAARLGVELTDKRIFYSATREELKWAKYTLAKHDIVPDVFKVGISAMANTPEKCPSRDFWCKCYRLVRAMYSGKVRLFFFGKNRTDIANVGNSAFFFGNELRETAALLKQMDLFISGDSGLLYLALALDIPTLGLFGVTPGESVKYLNFHFIDRRSEVCDKYCYGKPVCKETPGKCIQAITPNEVATKIGEILRLKPSKIKTGKHQEVKKVTVFFSVGGLGDTLTITPGLRQLKKDFPLSEITVILGSKENTKILENNPSIDRALITNELKKYSSRPSLKFDITWYPAEYETSVVPNVRKSRVQLYSEAMGNRRLSDKSLVFCPTVKELKWAKNTADSFKNRIAIGIQPRSRETYKDWPLEYWGSLVRLIKADFPRLSIFNFDPKIDIENTSPIREEIRRVITLLNFFDLIISPDSFLLHAAAIYSKPTVGIFGPSGYRAGYKNVVVCQRSDIPCCPCWMNASMVCNPHPGRQRQKEDGYSESMCLLKLMPELVFEKVKPIIEELRCETKGGSNNSRGKKRTIASP